MSKDRNEAPIRAYKLFRLRKNGTLGSLFINRRQVIPVGKWLRAECHPTTNFALRPGWHVALRPYAPHLTMKGRVWMEVEIKNFSTLKRPQSQGGLWLIAKHMRVIGAINNQKQPKTWQTTIANQAPSCGSPKRKSEGHRKSSST